MIINDYTDMSLNPPIAYFFTYRFFFFGLVANEFLVFEPNNDLQTGVRNPQERFFPLVYWLKLVPCLGTQRLCRQEFESQELFFSASGFFNQSY